MESAETISESVSVSRGLEAVPMLPSRDASQIDLAEISTSSFTRSPSEIEVDAKIETPIGLKFKAVDSITRSPAKLIWYVPALDPFMARTTAPNVKSSDVLASELRERLPSDSTR